MTRDGIEAGTATTAGRGAQHESPVLAEHAPNTVSPPIREHGEGVREALELAKAALDSIYHYTFDNGIAPGNLRRYIQTEASSAMPAITAALSAQPVKAFSRPTDPSPEVFDEWIAQPVKDAVLDEAGDDDTFRVPNLAHSLAAVERECIRSAQLHVSGGWRVHYDYAGPVMLALADKRILGKDSSYLTVLGQAVRAVLLHDAPEAALSPKSPASVGLDPETLARKFHEAYERLAPAFGYDTRKETRAFDPSSPNGRLMIAVCQEIATLTPEDRP